MAFQDFLVAPRDDELGKLRREEAFQPPDAAQLFHLVGDAGFEASVQFGDLLGALAQLAQEPRILHRNDGLRREVLQQRNLSFGKRPYLPAVSGYRADQFTVLAQRDSNIRSSATQLYEGALAWIAGFIGRFFGKIFELNEVLAVEH